MSEWKQAVGEEIPCSRNKLAVAFSSLVLAAACQSVTPETGSDGCPDNVEVAYAPTLNKLKADLREKNQGINGFEISTSDDIRYISLMNRNDKPIVSYELHRELTGGLVAVMSTACQ